MRNLTSEGIVIFLLWKEGKNFNIHIVIVLWDFFHKNKSIFFQYFRSLILEKYVIWWFHDSQILLNTFTMNYFQFPKTVFQIFEEFKSKERIAQKCNFALKVSYSHNSHDSFNDVFLGVHHHDNSCADFGNIPVKLSLFSLFKIWLFFSYWIVWLKSYFNVISLCESASKGRRRTEIFTRRQFNFLAFMDIPILKYQQCWIKIKPNYSNFSSIHIQCFSTFSDAFEIYEKRIDRLIWILYKQEFHSIYVFDE